MPPTTKTQLKSPKATSRNISCLLMCLNGISKGDQKRQQPLNLWPGEDWRPDWPAGLMLTNRRPPPLQHLHQRCRPPWTGGTPSGPPPPAWWCSWRAPGPSARPSAPPPSSRPRLSLPRRGRSRQKAGGAPTPGCRSGTERTGRRCTWGSVSQLVTSSTVLSFSPLLLAIS